MHRVTTKYMMVLNAYWIGLSFMWNSLHVTILPAVLLNYVPETQKNTWLGLLTFAGLVIAMVVQPLAGAVSDHWVSRFGRRRPFVLFGTIGDLIFLAVLGYTGGLPALFIGYVGLQFTSNIAHGPMQGLLPDEVPNEQLGIASGIKVTLDMSGTILSTLVMGFLIKAENPNPALSITAIILLLICTSSISIFLSHEKKIPDEKRPRIRFQTLWREVFNFKTEGSKYFWQLIFSRFLYLVGIYSFQSFAQYFIRDKFGPHDPILFTQVVMGIFVVVLIIFSLVAGNLSDRIGRKKVQILSCFIGAVGAILMVFAVTPAELFIYSSILGSGLGMFLSTNWALANEMAPETDSGKFIGLTNLATAGSAAIAKLEGPMTDGLNNAAPGVWMGWTVLFIVSAVLMLASAYATYKIPEPGLPASAPDKKPVQ